MKKKEIKELHIKTKKELENLIQKAQEELVNLRVDLKAGKIKNAHRVVLERRDLARMKTILKEKENETI